MPSVQCLAGGEPRLVQNQGLLNVEGCCVYLTYYVGAIHPAEDILKGAALGHQMVSHLSKPAVNSKVLRNEKTKRLVLSCII